MKKILRIPYLYIIPFFLLSGFVHPFYVSVSQIGYNSESKSLEIACKIFVDDLETALEAAGAKDLYIGLENEKAGADDIIDNYLRKHIDIRINGEKVEGSFLGKEVVDDVIWSYIEYQDVAFPSEFSIDNTLLIDELEGQQNIVHVKVAGKEKSLRLFKGRSKDVLNF
ncbi:MAG: DUF6702 family protein [Bacteroidia bacterium]|nr:DUF6702 family protein [Bacteroidia bacterium]